MSAATKPDPDRDGWSVDDEVVQLREWAGERVYRLPSVAGIYSVGSANDCLIRLEHPNGLLSRHHLELVLHDARWSARDISTNGFKLDGVETSAATLVPGAELWLAGLRLVAESLRFVKLRGHIERLIGWEPTQRLAVDLALRAIRLAVSRRSLLVLVGDEDLIPIARALHRRLYAAGRPFVVCDPRRKETDENVRNAQSFELGVPALLAAQRGTLCVWGHALPSDWEELKQRIAAHDVRTHILVCSRDRKGAEKFGEPVLIPKLSKRKGELPRIVSEYVDDAVDQLGAAGSLAASERDWIAENECSSLTSVERAAFRLVALRREHGNLSRAASALGMARMSLADWARRRKLPIRIID